MAEAMPADYEELRRAAEARCPDCDAPLATQADYDGHKNGCQCRRCQSLCWRAWNGNSCEREPVDWRDRCLALRAGAEARDWKVSEMAAKHMDGLKRRTERAEADLAALRAGVGEAERALDDAVRGLDRAERAWGEDRKCGGEMLFNRVTHIHVRLDAALSRLRALDGREASGDA